MSRSRIFPVLLLVVLASCQGGGASNSGEASSTSTSSADRGRGGESTPFIDKSAPAVTHRVSDARILLVQPKSRASMVMVNARNSKLADRNGRLAIAGGDPGLGFKRISDLQVDALLGSMENYDSRVLAEPFGPQHERMLKARDGEIGDYYGIIVIENEGARTAYVGRRPGGPADTLGKKRYEIFVNLKVLVMNAYNAEGTVEFVDQSGDNVATPGLGR